MECGKSITRWWDQLAERVDDEASENARCAEHADTPLLKSDPSSISCIGTCSVTDCCEAGCPVDLEVTGPLAVPVPAQIKHGVTNFGPINCAHPGTVTDVSFSCSNEGLFSLTDSNSPCPPPPPTCITTGYNNNRCKEEAPSTPLSLATTLGDNPCPGGVCNAGYCCSAPGTCAGAFLSSNQLCTAAAPAAGGDNAELVLNNPDAGACEGLVCQHNECCMKDIGFYPISSISSASIAHSIADFYPSYVATNADPDQTKQFVLDNINNALANGCGEDERTVYTRLWISIKNHGFRFQHLQAGE